MLKLGRFEALGTVPQKTWSSFMFLYVIIACPCACPSHRSLILSCPGVAKLGKDIWIIYFKKNESIPSPFHFKIKCAGFWNSFFFQVANCQIPCDAHLHLPQIGPSVFLPSLSPIILHHTFWCPNFDDIKIDITHLIFKCWSWNPRALWTCFSHGKLSYLTHLILCFYPGIQELPHCSHLVCS